MCVAIKKFLRFHLGGYDHREVDRWVAKLIFFCSTTLLLLVLTPNFLLVENISVARCFDMNAKLGHIWGDLPFGANVFLFGCWVDRVYDKLWVYHLRKSVPILTREE